MVSSISSSIIIYLGIKYFKKCDLTIKLFFVLMLISSYSFFGQSLIAKFYTLNTLLIFILFLLGYKLLFNYDIKIQLIICFLLGLAAGIHHTTYFIIIPYLILLIFYYKKIIRIFHFSLLFFFLGFINVFYLLIRSQKPLLVNISPSPDIKSLFYTLSRKAYGTSSSLDIIKSAFFFNVERLFYAAKNAILNLTLQFHEYSWVFFLMGLIYLFKQNKRTFLYLLLTFISYSIFLSYFTFYNNNDINKIETLYIVAHQYFLPAFLFFAIISTFGLKFILKLFPNKLNRLKYIFLIFPIIYIPNNYFTNFYDKNYVPYFKTIDQLFVKPIKSIIIYSGDNDVFQAWYLKNVEKFRDDICILGTRTLKNKIWNINNGCNFFIYNEAYSEIYQGNYFNIANLKGYIRKRRVFSNSLIEENLVLKRYLKSYYDILDFLVLMKTQLITEEILERRKKYYPFLHYDYCISHHTDDLFTMALCAKYATALTYLAYDIGKNFKNGKQTKITLNFNKFYKKFKINVTSKNELYLYKSMVILENNKLSDFYLFDELKK